MFKLVVLSALLAVAVAKPSHIASYVAPSVYAAPAVTSYGAAPLVSTYAHSPLVSTYAAAPLHSTYAAAPLVSTYGAPLALGPNTPAAIINAAGRPLDTIDVVNARSAHYTAKVLNAHGIHKRSVALGYSAGVYAAPAAVSHQSRIDIPTTHAVVSSPLVSTYSAPIVSSYSSPLVSAYSAPLVSAYSSPIARVW